MRSISAVAVLCVITIVGVQGCASGGFGRGKANVSVSPATKSTFDRAVTAMKLGQNKKAEQILLGLTKSNPDLAGPYANLGIIYRRTGRLEASERAFKKSIENNPYRAETHNQLGILYRNLGRFKEALDAYQKAMKADPNYPYAHLNAGILYDLYLGDGNKALIHYQRYQSLLPKEDKQVTQWINELKRRVNPPARNAQR